MDNIFNLLRYPVTIKFQVEDLAGIPSSVINEWWQFASVQGKTHHPSNRARIPAHPARISSYLNHHTCMADRKMLYKKLVQLIMEIEHEPV